MTNQDKETQSAKPLQTPPVAHPQRPPQSTAVSVTQTQKSIRSLIARADVQDRIKAVLPRHLSPDRITRLVFGELNNNPKLYECDPYSLVGAIIKSAQLGLEPGVNGQAYLIPFKGKVEFVAGYRGLIDLIMRTKMFNSVRAFAVFDGDRFEYRRGLEETLNHVPLGESDPVKLTHVYAIARLKDGPAEFEVMNREEIERVRMTSKQPDGPAWRGHYSEMAKKTVIRRLAKQLPFAIEKLDDVDRYEREPSDAILSDTMDLGGMVYDHSDSQISV